MVNVNATTEWARANGVAYHYSAALDNHEPTRSYATGTLYVYADEKRGASIILTGRDQFRDDTKAVFLIDNGWTVEPYYVAAWRPENGHLILHPFPTNYNADGTPKLRTDDGRPVDYANWFHGPRRAYHLKVRAVDPAENDPLYRLLDD